MLLLCHCHNCWSMMLSVSLMLLYFVMLLYLCHTPLRLSCGTSTLIPLCKLFCLPVSCYFTAVVLLSLPCYLAPVTLGYWCHAALPHAVISHNVLSTALSLELPLSCWLEASFHPPLLFNRGTTACQLACSLLLTILPCHSDVVSPISKLKVMGTKVRIMV